MIRAVVADSLEASAGQDDDGGSGEPSLEWMKDDAPTRRNGMGRTADTQG